MYLCRRYTDASLSEIGRAFGRDHPAVAQRDRDASSAAILERAPLRYQVEELAARLEGRERRAALRPKAPAGGAWTRARPCSPAEATRAR